MLVKQKWLQLPSVQASLHSGAQSVKYDSQRSPNIPCRRRVDMKSGGNKKHVKIVNEKTTQMLLLSSEYHNQRHKRIRPLPLAE